MVMPPMTSSKNPMMADDTNIKTNSCAGNKTLLPGHSGRNDSHQPQTLQQYNGHLMSQGKKCFRNKNLQFGKITCFCSKIYNRNFSTRILGYITHQISKPMICGSQTLHDQLQPTASFWDRECTCNITWRHMCATTVAVEKQ